jgi:starvation-inducible outer membrane lipoprotein
MAIFFAERQKIAPLRGRMAYVSVVLLMIATAGLVGCMTLPPALTQKGASSVTVTSTSGGVSKTTTVNINVN